MNTPSDSPTPHHRTPTPAAVDIALSSATVRVSANSVTVTQTVRARVSDTGPVTSRPQACCPTLQMGRKFRPGELSFDSHSALPAVRVTPSNNAAALAVCRLIDAACTSPSIFERTVAAVLSDGIAQCTPAPETDQHWEQPAAPAPAPTASPDTDPTTAEGLNFVAFDIETANANNGSICAIGLAVVRDGDITETHSWLCRPPAGLDCFESANIGVHGITAEDVADAPSFGERLTQFSQITAGQTVIAHNAAFDFSGLYSACKAAGLNAPERDFACTLWWSRKAGVDTVDKKLPTLAAAAGAPLLQHHDAASDAVACAHIALWLMRSYSTNPTAGPRAFTKELNLNLGHISNDRLDTGARKTRPHQNPAWAKVATPDVVPAPNPNAAADNPLYGHNITLTGEFMAYTKGQLWEAIADRGATVGKGVTKKTTIVVVGQWKTMTGKEKRARQLQEQGQAIEIWQADDLYRHLGWQ
ncbi:hypothetical protein KRX51_09745 [Corynebacterium sp. TAE3-ERU12]|uniref:exonuclease domain-containing protein n=1 Tax=Corynebacterium sp. TAE3-ERU12 TaxID=2849491 RepID=UPI001C4728EB|nr:exonuclease domain-containing protein [Corynebacterium sp. TAE3-ERU12]MBV7296192.1 hypothetical protein [Corynebacterium sp. TAE3-ERU12]